MGAKDLPYEEFLQAVADRQLLEEYRAGYVATFSIENVMRHFKAGNNYLQYEFMITENGSDYFWMRIDAYIFIRKLISQCICLLIVKISTRRNARSWKHKERLPQMR